MLPGIYEFRWDAGHVIFLGAFFTVLATIGITLLVVAARARRDRRTGAEDRIRWHEDFETLPASRRRCRHEITGDVAERVCENEFACGRCEEHNRLVAQAQAKDPGRAATRATAAGPAADAPAAGPAADAPAAGPAAVVLELYGLRLPLDRLYHRGHTWVEDARDGTVTIGLDELGQRLLGTPDALALPAPGSHVHANGRAWEMVRGGKRLRVLAPIDGTVVETGDVDRGWLLRVCPDEPLFAQAHLLRRREIRPWIEREIEFLAARLATPALGPTLADGGELMRDLPKAHPEVDWQSVWDDVFLEG
jgi:hypothetical protein